MNAAKKSAVLHCGECGSTHVGWDAWVDQFGDVNGGPFAHYICLDCGANEPELVEVFTR